MGVLEALRLLIKIFPDMTVEQRRPFIIIGIWAVVAIIIIIWVVCDIIYVKFFSVRAIRTSATVSKWVLRGNRQRRKEMKTVLEAVAKEISDELGVKKVYFAPEIDVRCNAGTNRKNRIGFNQFYAKLYNEEGAETLYFMTAYHELGHIISYGKKDGYRIFSFNLAKNRFRHYVEETFCDHISLLRGPVKNCDEWIARKECLYTERCKKHAFCDHPSWNKRFEYLKSVFGRELILQVAEDLRYRLNDDELNRILAHYDAV